MCIRDRTIHDIVRVKEPGLAALLHYDLHERRSGLVHLLPADGSTAVENLVRSSYRELGDFVDAVYVPDVVDADRLVLRREGHVVLDAVAHPLTVTKPIRLGGARLNPSLEFETAATHAADSPV